MILIGERMRREGNKFSTCYRCQTNNTVRIVTSEEVDKSSLVYAAWCYECEAPYSYRIRMDTVWDQEGRI